jgi:hypothetical protein
MNQEKNLVEKACDQYNATHGNSRATTCADGSVQICRREYVKPLVLAQRAADGDWLFSRDITAFLAANEWDACLEEVKAPPWRPCTKEFAIENSESSECRWRDRAGGDWGFWHATMLCFCDDPKCVYEYRTSAPEPKPEWRTCTKEFALAHPEQSQARYLSTCSGPDEWREPGVYDYLHPAERYEFRTTLPKPRLEDQPLPAGWHWEQSRGKLYAVRNNGQGSLSTDPASLQSYRAIAEAEVKRLAAELAAKQDHLKDKREYLAAADAILKALEVCQ